MRLLVPEKLTSCAFTRLNDSQGETWKKVAGLPVLVFLRLPRQAVETRLAMKAHMAMRDMTEDCKVITQKQSEANEMNLSFRFRLDTQQSIFAN